MRSMKQRWSPYYIPNPPPAAPTASAALAPAAPATSPNPM